MNEVNVPQQETQNSSLKPKPQSKYVNSFINWSFNCDDNSHSALVFISDVNLQWLLNMFQRINERNGTLRQCKCCGQKLSTNQIYFMQVTDNDGNKCQKVHRSDGFQCSSEEIQ